MNRTSFKLPLPLPVCVFVGRLALVALLLALVSGALHAQTNRFPANVTPTLGLPYSLFISDYTDPGRQQLVANILFNDFNEPQWTFKLRLRLESMDIRLETRPDFIPSQPITVSPGQPFRFTGADWTEYFDYRNLNIAGPGREALLSSGRLPEGGYTLYLQVLDYETGEPLSPETLVSWWMGLYNPPMLILPEADSYINPSATQISFTWQLFNIASPGSLGTEYQLTLWEVTEHTQSLQRIDPYSVIQNGQALQIYQSEIVVTPSLVYGASEPALEPGKVYIYRVQALDPEGKDSFKNGGHSEYRRFYYGWPLNGNIRLAFPEENHTMSLTEQAHVEWYPPDKKLPSQPVQYEVRIAEKGKEESAEQALAGNLWYHHETIPSATDRKFTHIIEPTVPTQQYAWEVIASSDGQEVGRSPQQVFYGPPLMARFYANVHRIEVISINDDRNDLSGTGKVRLTPTSEWTEVRFEHLKVARSGQIWTLREGQIFIDTHKKIELAPNLDENGKASFTFTRYRLDKDGLWVFGQWEWALHLATLSDDRAMIRTTPGWYHYNELQVVGYARLDQPYRLDLLDPFGFQLEIDSSSVVRINSDGYRMELNGFIGLPEKVRSITGQGRVKIPYLGQGQLFYYASDNLPLLSPLYVSDAIGVLLETTDYTIDLSENQSPTAFAASPDWKGIVFNQYTLTIPQNFDSKGRYSLTEDVVREFEGPGQPAYVGRGGIYLNTTIDFDVDQEFSFNTFPGFLERFTLEVAGNEISDKSSLSGNAIIPLLSTTEPFVFHVPMTSQGFMSGYFEGVEGYRFVHNTDNKEQRLNVTVKRAVIEDDERLNMTLDLEWPALGAKMEGLRYFKVWGNYNVGFYTPEGMFALDQQLNARYRDYPVTIDAIAAGRSSGQYGFGVSGKINLGDDVAGDGGAPAFNLYSLAANELLPGDYVPKAKDVDLGNLTSTDVEAEKAKIEAEVEEEKENLVAALDARSRQMEGEIDAEVTAIKARWGGRELLAEDMIDVPEEDSVEGIEVSVAYEMIPEVLRKTLEFFPEESAAVRFSRRVLKLEKDGQQDMYQNLKEVPQDLAVESSVVLIEQAMKPLEREMTKVTDRVNSEALRLTGEVNREVEEVVNNLVGNACREVIDLLADQSPDIATIVGGIALTVKQEIIFEIQASISQSVYDNVTFPIATLLHDQVLGRVEIHLQKMARDATMAAFTPGANPSEVIEESFGTLDNVLARAGDDVLTFISPENMVARIQALGSDALGNISGERIMGRIKAGAINVIAAYTANKVAGAFNELTNQALSDELGVAIPIDIGGAVTKLLSGGSVKDVLSDPIPVKVRSKALDFNGLIHFMQGHPVYGDGFSGMIEARIKVPDENRPIEIMAAYMNGRTAETPYWFVEVGGGAAKVKGNKNEAPEGMDQVGGEMSGEMSEPKGVINLGVAKIMAMRGRVYKHMSGTKLEPLTPNAANKFGAYLHLVLYGPKNGERMRLEVEGQVNTYTDGNLVLDLAGNVQVDNVSPQVMRPDPNASVQGAIEIRYNKKEKHFFGYATVVLKTEGMCGEGSLLVDVKPGYWRVALGNREDRIGIVPGCVGLAYYGWIDLNSDFVEVGAGLGLAFYKEFGVNVGVAKLALIVDAGINANVFASVNYKPLTIREVGIFVETWARVLVAYQILAKKGKVELVDVYLYASSIMRFYPPPTLLYGTLKGHIRLIKIISFDFKKDYEIEI